MNKISIARKNFLREMGALFLLAMTLLVWSATAHAQDLKRVGSKFNHTSTGFPLTGVHVNVECETCHTGGIFKGTPTNCAGCHAPGRRVVALGKPANHVVTNSPCEICHTNTVTFMGARFDHLGVQPGACQTCHNSAMAAGKPARHVTTTRACDSCHRTSAWIPASFNHQGMTADCSTCHISGQNTYYKGVISSSSTGSNGHTSVATSLCRPCHTNYASFQGARYDHAGASPTCSTCHTLKPAGHIATTDECGTCHKSTSTWLGAKNHTPTANCWTCHSSKGHPGDKGAVSGQSCASSGCHQPGGPYGTAYVRWTN